MKYSGIGGQAVIEGVMMMNRNDYAVAVRRPDSEIEIKKDKYESITTKSEDPVPALYQRRIPVCGFHDTGNEDSDVFRQLFLKMMRKKNRADLKSFWTAFSEKNWKALLCQLLWYFLFILAIGIFMILPLVIANFFKSFITSEHVMAVLRV